MKSYYFKHRKIITGIISAAVFLQTPVLIDWINSTDSVLKIVSAERLNDEPEELYGLLIEQIGNGIKISNRNFALDNTLSFNDQVLKLLSKKDNFMSEEAKKLAIAEMRLIDYALNQLGITYETLLPAMLSLKSEQFNFSFARSNEIDDAVNTELINALKENNSLYTEWVNQYKGEILNNRSKSLAHLNSMIAEYEQFTWQTKNKSESLDVFMQNWSAQMNQQYQRIPRDSIVMPGHFDNPTTITAKVFKKSTIQGHPVNWSVNEDMNHNGSIYVVVDVYQQINQPNGHLYIFTIHDGQPIVLHANGNIDSENLDFKPTENIMLVEGFQQIVSEREIYTRDIDHSTKENELNEPKQESNHDFYINEKTPENFVREYGEKVGKEFLFASPATYRVFKNLSIPDELLDNMTVNGQEVSTKFYGMYGGQGDSFVEWIEIFVDSQSSQVIIFAEQDGQKKVLVNSDLMIVQGKIDFIEASDPILLQWY
ncbi:DUF4767 domain-containing protein [Aerococcaceae bacterium zg-BR9]|uniref:DUF4767 domain-containing protein n=1 Tax=Aerococcaceae bacterium zg-1292 TaxID=2774330 RepID=UPI0040646A83|nr:DUF4767 domain-containing protein [Aerococcaceae bacterium zg-BR9]